MKSVRRKGFEMPTNRLPRCSNLNKLDNNISRARSKIKEYSLCNEFEYFVTLTIDSTKYDRYNFKQYYKDFSKFINNYNSYNKTKIEYVFIPERHYDGAWHMHGLVKGILKKHLFVNDNGYLDWKQYSKKFGYISMGKIRNRDRCSSYVTKYITKDIDNTISELNLHMYYASKGLKKAETIKEGRLRNDLQYDFENDYVKIKTFPYLSNSEIDNLIKAYD